MNNDRSYFMRRAAQERSAAANAAGDKAREAHQEMARRYHGLAEAGVPEPASEPAAP
jgi:hypothetical protein